MVNRFILQDGDAQRLSGIKFGIQFGKGVIMVDDFPTCAQCGMVLSEENPREHKCDNNLNTEISCALLKILGFDQEDD